MKILFYILTIVLTFFMVDIYACSCVGKKTVKEEMKQSKAVIVGTILSKELVTLRGSVSMNVFTGDSSIYKPMHFEFKIAKYEFVIENIYKGRFKTDTIELYTGLNDEDCGVSFKIGNKYIVYGGDKNNFEQLNNDKDFPKGNNILWTDRCSRTTIFNQKEIVEINNFQKKK